MTPCRQAWGELSWEMLVHADGSDVLSRPTGTGPVPRCSAVPSLPMALFVVHLGQAQYRLRFHSRMQRRSLRLNALRNCVACDQLMGPQQQHPQQTQYRWNCWSFRAEELQMS